MFGIRKGSYFNSKIAIYHGDKTQRPCQKKKSRIFIGFLGVVVLIKLSIYLS